MTKNSDPATDPRIKERPLKKYLRCTLTDDEKVELRDLQLRVKPPPAAAR